MIESSGPLSISLPTSVWKQEKRLTRKGWRVELATSKILFSASSDSTSSRAMMSPFFSALMAKYSLVFRYCAKMTCRIREKETIQFNSSILNIKQFNSTVFFKNTLTMIVIN